MGVEQGKKTTQSKARPATKKKIRKSEFSTAEKEGREEIGLRKRLSW